MFEPDLIYDVGMHKGEDTEYYLAKGFRVVAFEANPALIAAARQRFAAELADGRLVIVEGAISDDTSSDTVTFYQSSMSVWGTVCDSFEARAHERGQPSNRLTVPRVDFAEALQRYGVPYYLKIDIEGMDLACLKAMERVPGRPKYLSIESTWTHFSGVEEEIAQLSRLGYDGFKIVQQQGISAQREPAVGESRALGWRFREGSSGLFGADLPGEWMGREKTLDRYASILRLHRWLGYKSLAQRLGLARFVTRAYRIVTGRYIPGWHDTHARLADPGPHNMAKHLYKPATIAASFERDGHPLSVAERADLERCWAAWTSGDTFEWTRPDPIEGKRNTAVLQSELT
ncbi:MAG: FkbM family methyltransferase [Rhizorhabdus sp.]|uniref:FkbM family methyltransferase n=1 Tax=Rhizorhabdus sp. TaxID=1968843 RepID=UPI001B6876F2|nr:FkbM family methyltransferase [Rhizorhabdus sp.]MBP8235738.1 FkbM family methyltransferase [Rhizorhabdus sp.]